MLKFSVLNFRNFIFGVEDSLVSTVGLLSGIAIAGTDSELIFLTGMVLIFVEAFSMAAGSFLSEHSAEEFSERRNMRYRSALGASVVMFFSYFITGFIPLFPYLVFGLKYAILYSIIFSLVALFILGMVSGRLSRVNLLRSGIKMAVIGGLAIAVGILVSSFVNLD